MRGDVRYSWPFARKGYHSQGWEYDSAMIEDRSSQRLQSHLSPQLGDGICSLIGTPIHVPKVSIYNVIFTEFPRFNLIDNKRTEISN